MGNTFTVEVWGKHFSEHPYCFLTTWQGESLLRALWELFKAKKRGFGCTKLSWR